MQKYMVLKDLPFCSLGTILLFDYKDEILSNDEPGGSYLDHWYSDDIEYAFFVDYLQVMIKDGWVIEIDPSDPDECDCSDDKIKRLEWKNVTPWMSELQEKLNQIIDKVNSMED